MNKLELSISSDPDNICQVEHFIENIITTFYVTDKLQGNITLAIIEAANNAILYGNKSNYLMVTLSDKLRFMKKGAKVVMAFLLNEE